MKKVLVVGNNAVAWLSALALRQHVMLDVTVLDLEGSTDGGSRTALLTPETHAFHQQLNMHEKDLVRNCHGSFQLACRYQNAAPADAATGKCGYDFMLGFSPVGVDLDGIGFQHHFCKQGLPESARFEDYSVACQMARRDKFVHPVNNNQSVLSTLQYGIQLDSQRYKDVCARYAKQAGVKSLYSKSIMLNLENWHIASVNLDNELEIQADFFIDATDEGLLHRMLLPEQCDHLARPYNRLLRFSGANESHPATHSHIRAFNGGVLKSIPLSDRIEYEAYFNCELTDEQRVMSQVQAMTGLTSLEHVIFQQITQQCTTQHWKGNCVALGEYSGSPDPVSGSAIQRAQSAITRLMDLLPDGSEMGLSAAEYNRVTQLEYLRSQEFENCLFHLTYQPESDFWIQANGLPISDRLQHKLAVFTQSGRIAKFEEDPMPPHRWLSLLIGLNQKPEGYDPMLDMRDASMAAQKTSRIVQIIGQTIENLPSHSTYLQHYLTR